MNCVEDDMNERSKHGLPTGLFKVICAVSVFAMIAVVGCGTGKVCAKPTRKSTEKMVPQAAGTEIRTESEVMSRGGRQEQESDTVKKLVQKESDIKAWLVPAETEVASLKKEIDRLVTAHMHVVDVLDENAVKRVKEDNEDTSRQGACFRLMRRKRRIGDAEFPRRGTIRNFVRLASSAENSYLHASHPPLPTR